MKKIVVFSGNLSYSVRKGIVDLIDHVDDVQIMIVEQAQKKPVSKLIKNQYTNLKKNGWRWIPYQTADIVQRVVERFSAEQPSPVSAPGKMYDRGLLLGCPAIDYLNCTDMHAQEVLQAVQKFSPDLGLSLAAPILREPLFTIPKNGTINLHKGKVPFYRGMPPAFWELTNGEAEVGCTIHKVEKGLDTGEILVQSVVPVQQFSTLKGMQLALDELGVTLMNSAVQSIFDGSANWQTQPSGGKTYRKPTLQQVGELDRKLAHGGNQSTLKRWIKDAVFFAYSHVYRPLPKRILAAKNSQRVNIILYHRVSDEFRDSVTVGVEQFDRQMAILNKTCTVISIEDVIRGDIPYNSKRAIVAVTFDDGYLDNYESAVPILLKHQVPTAFFVSTGIVGSENGFAHDIDKLGRALPNMSWDQISRMHEWGFTIGSHTVSHINCGKDDPEKVRAEIVQAKATLEDKLGLQEVIFAYPFGKQEDFNQDMLEFVKSQGHIACLSAYGGRNGKPIDKYNIMRTGVDANFTDAAFRARLEGFQR